MWKEALKLGLNTYSTGKPCKRGHKTERYVTSKACVKCVQLYTSRKLSETITLPCHPQDRQALIAFAKFLESKRKDLTAL